MAEDIQKNLPNRQTGQTQLEKSDIMKISCSPAILRGFVLYKKKSANNLTSDIYIYIAIMVVSIFFILSIMISPKRIPQAYQVEGYEEISNASSAIFKLNDPTRKILLDELLNGQKETEIRDAARPRRQEMIADKKKLEELQWEWEKSSDQLKEIQKLKEKLETWIVVAQLYQWDNNYRLQGSIADDVVEWYVDHNGSKQTFVRKEWVPRSFEQMGIEIKDFASDEDATTYMKEWPFAKYATGITWYKDLFASSNRFEIPDTLEEDLYNMTYRWIKDNNMSFAGRFDKDGSRESNTIDRKFLAYTNISVNGELVSIYNDCGHSEFGMFMKSDNPSKFRLSVWFVRS